MIPTAPTMNAAIPVIDEKNIAQAIEMVNRTQKILNGKTTLAGAALDEIEREKALDQTFLDAALAAEDAQKTNADVAEATQNLLEQMPNTQGVLQNIQIGNQLNAQSVVALLNLNKQVASQIQAEAVHYQDKALQRARRLKADEYQRKAAAEALGQQ